MIPGQKVYRVKWQKGVPFIERGAVEGCGRNLAHRKARFPSDGKLTDLAFAGADMREAIAKEIQLTAGILMPSLRRPERKAEPWTLAFCVAELMRLYRRLARHHLVPDRPED